MYKTCVRRNPNDVDRDIRDLIMLEDSAAGTICAIHKTICSTDNFPSSKHQMLKLCPMLKCGSKIPVRNRRKSRSNSPCNKQIKPPCRRSCSASSPQRCNPAHQVVRPGFRSVVNVEKTISCPEKVCCLLHSNRNCCFTSRSSLQVDQNIAHSILCTDEIVTELKGEIERVKHQLRHIASAKETQSQPLPPCQKNENEATKLKNENKKLKRELDAKKKLLEARKQDIDKVKEILKDYEKKVGLLHTQALKTSKAMKISKEKFCQCLKDKEEKIVNLKETNRMMAHLMEDKENESKNFYAEFDELKASFEEVNGQCSSLSESNQNFCQCIERLKEQLRCSNEECEKGKMTIKKMEQKSRDLSCACKKLKTKYDNRLRKRDENEKKLTEEISMLSAKITEADNQKDVSRIELESKCSFLEDKLKEYESFCEKCQCLEQECKKHCEALARNERSFQKDREELQKLVDELTTVVNENKSTLLRMSEINKQQEVFIKTQSVALMSKEEQMKLIEKQSEDFKTKTEMLEKEVEELRKTMSEPCSKEACLCISRQLEQIRTELNRERDNHLMKEKIIQDQSETILALQSRVKERSQDLSKAQIDTKFLEAEIRKANDRLIQKHKELDRELDEKEDLIEKLKILEKQKDDLTDEIYDFEEMLETFKETYGDNNKQQSVLTNLEKQIEEQRLDWENQREIITKEKQKAVCAAKFATQKLLATVSDFQKQVEAQRQVQVLLTKMLHDKDAQLKMVTSKINDINHITREVSSKKKMKEIYRTNADNFVSSDQNTSSLYSSCSSCCKTQTTQQNTCNASCAKVLGLIELLKAEKDQT